MAEKVTILGAGSWGMAIARLLDLGGHAVTMWEFDATECQRLLDNRTIPDKLPGLKLADSVAITNDIGESLADATLVVSAVPAQFLQSALKSATGKLRPEVGLVNLAKGIEIESLRRMSEVISQETQPELQLIASLSGPSHAEEVIADMPTAVVAVGQSETFVRHVQEVFSHQSFRVYHSDDLIGVELGGSLKNIIAIAAGIAAGLGLGDNTLGALITRGLAEITRLGVTMGARPETFAGLSGIGDLVTTCASRHSRNRQVGERIGKGEKLNDILKSMSMIAEGVQTTRSGFQLAQLHQVEMPITGEVYKMLFEDKPPAQAVGELMGRSLKAEVWQ
jgi:glycerol-3-phosphate dehydrogenase (NAD(P)+)